MLLVGAERLARELLDRGVLGLGFRSQMLHFLLVVLDEGLEVLRVELADRFTDRVPLLDREKVLKILFSLAVTAREAVNVLFKLVLVVLQRFLQFRELNQVHLLLSTLLDFLLKLSDHPEVLLNVSHHLRQ